VEEEAPYGNIYENASPKNSFLNISAIKAN
jgi:hypothetical protein